MINGKWIGKDVEGNGRGLIKGRLLSRYFPDGAEEEQRKLSG
jgi:hypothetical protein